MDGTVRDLGAYFLMSVGHGCLFFDLIAVILAGDQKIIWEKEEKLDSACRTAQSAC